MLYGGKISPAIWLGKGNIHSVTQDSHQSGTLDRTQEPPHYEPAAETILRIRPKLEGLTDTGNPKWPWKFRCPATGHEDKDPSCYGGIGDHGQLIFKCHGRGCSVEEIKRGLEIWEEAPAPARRRKPAREKKPKSTKGDGPPWETVATYQYRDAGGNLLFESVRKERTVAGERKKKFVTQHTNASGKTVRNITNVQRVLYHLQDLVDPKREKEPVWVVEGEKCADYLREKHGLLATCNPLGAGKWSAEYSETLRGRDVIVLRDYDDTGKRHADEVADSLFGLARRVRVPDLPGLTHTRNKGQDVYDWMETLAHSLSELHEQANAAKLIQTVTLEDVLDAYCSHLHLTDVLPVLTVLSAYAANKLAGDPLWLMLVAPPSGGKTEIIVGLSKLPEIHMTSNITAAGLRTGEPVKGKKSKDATGGLLNLIEASGHNGILLLKDFGSVLSMHRDARAALLAALREIFDGEWVRDLGSGGGEHLEWRGKLGLIGASTPAYDEHHAVISSLGDRFVVLRIPPDEGGESALQALRQTGKERAQREEIQTLVARFFRSLDFEGYEEENPEPFTEETKRRLSGLAWLVTRARSPVTRNNYTREIEFVAPPEQSPRFVKSLGQLYRGTAAIGVEEADRWRIIERVARDCIPPNRRTAIETLHGTPNPEGWTAQADVATALGHGNSTVAGRVLEDLACTGRDLVARQPLSDSALWKLTDRARELYPIEASRG